MAADPTRCLPLQQLRRLQQELQRQIPPGGFRPQQQEVAEGGQPAAAALGQQLPRERPVTLRHQVTQGRVLRMETLYHDRAGALGATCAAGNLHQQLAEVFLRAKVGTEKPAVGVEHRHQRNTRKVMPLGQHLGADQDAGHTALYDVHRFAELPGRACRIAVDAQHRVVRKAGLQIFRAALGSKAYRLEIVTVALWAAAW